MQIALSVWLSFRSKIERCLLMLESVNQQLNLKNVMKTDFDLSAYWMPYTGNRQFKQDPRIITGADGVWFTDSDGVDGAMWGRRGDRFVLFCNLLV